MNIKGSLYRKLLVSFLAVLLVTMTVFTILSTRPLQNFLVHQRVAVVEAQRGQLAGLLSLYALNYLSQNDFNETIRRFQNTYHVSVALVDPFGTLVYAPEGMNTKTVESIAARLLAGETAGNASLETYTLNEATFAVPLIFQRHFLGIAVFQMPIGTGGLYLQAFRSEFLSLVIALVVAVIMTYFISRHLTRPLLDLTKAAERIARGDFRKRVQVQTDDEIGHLALAFNRMMGQLEELEAVRREFIANVSHELRSPLTSIRGFVQGLVDDVIPEEEKGHYLRLTLKETERLNRLIDQILDAARVDSGQFALNKENVDIVQLVRHAVETMEPAIREKGQHLQVDLPAVAVRGHVDPDRVEQIVINLVSNAWQYTPEGGKIEVSLRQERDQAVITVSDTGEGISPQDLPHIWDRFFKADRSRTSKKVGTGLGLSIVKNLVDAHHGRVAVESTVGVGSVFRVWLPLAETAV
jgi:signal transduction histidine kinase